MTREDIIRMAREAGLFVHKEVQPELERFAALVAVAEQKNWQDQAMVDIHEAVLEEREACAKVCEQRSDPLGYANLTAEACAAAIRARKENT